MEETRTTTTKQVSSVLNAIKKIDKRFRTIKSLEISAVLTLLYKVLWYMLWLSGLWCKWIQSDYCYRHEVGQIQRGITKTFDNFSQWFGGVSTAEIRNQILEFDLVLLAILIILSLRFHNMKRACSSVAIFRLKWGRKTNKPKISESLIFWP